MQFRHFDGSLTNVPSIHDALIALDRKDDWRNPEATVTTGRVVSSVSVKAEDVDSNGRVVLTEREHVVGQQRDDAYLPDVTVDYDSPVNLNDVEPVAWNETEYGFYREDVTRRYQAKLLNVYRSNGTLCVGSVRITPGENGNVSATCVKCKATLSVTEDQYYGLGYDAELMQDFTAAVIRHGHNHSAKWVSKTPVGVPA